MTLLSDRVHHELKRRLTVWEYLPGTRMGEEALAAEFGVSRTPVRDALRRAWRRRASSRTRRAGPATGSPTWTMPTPPA